MLCVGSADYELSRFDVAVRQLDGALTEAEVAAPHLCGEAALALSIALERQGKYQAVIDLCERWVQATQGQREAQLRMVWGTSLNYLGRHAEALAQYDTPTVIEAGAADLRVNFCLLNNRAIAYQDVGDLEAAIGDYTEAADVAAELESPLMRAVAEHNRGFVLAALGDLSGSLRLLDEAEHVFLESGNDAALGPGYLERALCLLDVGLLEEADIAAKAAADVARRANVPGLVMDAERLQARVALAAGRTHDAAAWADRAAETATTAGLGAEVADGASRFAASVRAFAAFHDEASSLPSPEELADLGPDLAIDVGLALADEGQTVHAQKQLARVVEVGATNALMQLGVAVAQARLAELDADFVAAERYVDLGLRAATDSMVSLGVTDLRTTASLRLGSSVMSVFRCCSTAVDITN